MRKKKNLVIILLYIGLALSAVTLVIPFVQIAFSESNFLRITEDVLRVFTLGILLFGILHTRDKVEDISEQDESSEIEASPVDMTRDEAIAFMKEHPGAKVTHTSFAEYEYLYADESGFIYDENDYLFEDWKTIGFHDGLRYRSGPGWEKGWSISNADGAANEE